MYFIKVFSCFSFFYQQLAGCREIASGECVEIDTTRHRFTDIISAVPIRRTTPTLIHTHSPNRTHFLSIRLAVKTNIFRGFPYKSRNENKPKIFSVWVFPY